MTYTYGPVSSWRYGRSLGIDVTLLPKKCTYNCIYCQLGTTKKHVADPEELQGEMPSSEEVISDVKETLLKLDLQTVDVLTLSGTGEPTLNLNLGLIISAIRKLAPQLPIVLLTNASLLPDDEILKGILEVDFVSAKLDAGDEATFKRINHPAKGSFHLEDISGAIKKLNRTSSCVVALEVMLLRGPRGLTNVEGHSRRTLVDRIVEIDPDIVQIYTPWRPTVVSTVKRVSKTTMQEFADELEEHIDVDRLWVYGVHDARGKAVVWKKHKSLDDEILTLLRRRPCRIQDVSLSLGIRQSVTANALKKLLDNKHVKIRQVGSDVFYESI